MTEQEIWKIVWVSTTGTARSTFHLPRLLLSQPTSPLLILSRFLTAPRVRLSLYSYCQHSPSLLITRFFWCLVWVEQLNAKSFFGLLTICSLWLFHLALSSSILAYLKITQLTLLPLTLFFLPWLWAGSMPVCTWTSFRLVNFSVCWNGQKLNCNLDLVIKLPRFMLVSAISP